jgi:hypothetical protein
MEAKFGTIAALINNEFIPSSQIQQSTDDDAAWTSIEKPSEPVRSSGIGDNEPWELEDTGEEKITPIPTTDRLTSAFNDHEYSTIEKPDAHNNFFSDAFNPPAIIIEKRSNISDSDKEDSIDYFPKHQPVEDTEPALSKSVRFDDNVQNIRPTTPPKSNLYESESSETSDSDEVEVDEITPTFEAVPEHVETNIKVYISFC